MIREAPIFQKLRVNCLIWLGHIVRMDDNNMAKQVFGKIPEGMRGRGRLKLR